MMSTFWKSQDIRRPTSMDFRHNNIKLGIWAEDTIRYQSNSIEQVQVPLYKSSVKELGFETPTYYSTIANTVRSNGFALCQKEVGLNLRLGYLDQPEGEKMAIIMLSESLPFLNARLDSYWLYYVLCNNQGQLSIEGNFADNTNKLSSDAIVVYTTP